MKLILLALIQSLLLCAGQMFMKLALKAMGAVAWSWSFVLSQLTNWWWLACGISFTAAGLLWMYILKKFPFSMAYPMISLSYVFGMIAAIVFFHESIPLTRWIGVFLIITGCVLIAR